MKSVIAVSYFATKSMLNAISLFQKVAVSQFF